ncbi:MAG: hypothetical protein CL908_06370 [Deltaproteobacteria bacterium]|nr:hypothetical protein [Deltaproteobacteria bacterium]
MNTGSLHHADGSHEDRCDFDRLEECVDFLLKKHERLSAEREALLAELVEREHRATTLEMQLEGERARREAAIESVDKILSRLEQLQTSVNIETVEVAASAGQGAAATVENA